MYTKIQVVFDAAEPEKLAEFWGLALGYVVEPPPQGFATWEEFGRSIGLAEEKFGDQAFGAGVWRLAYASGVRAWRWRLRLAYASGVCVWR